jgi:hypothetical protein
MKELAYGAFRLETNGGFFRAAPTVFHPPSDHRFGEIYTLCGVKQLYVLEPLQYSKARAVTEGEDAGTKEVKSFRLQIMQLSHHAGVMIRYSLG